MSEFCVLKRWMIIFTILFLLPERVFNKNNSTKHSGSLKDEKASNKTVHLDEEENIQNKTSHGSDKEKEKSDSSETTTTESESPEKTTESNYEKIISGVKGLWKSFYQRHFVDKYKKLKDFFSSSKKELQQKVDDTENYLATVIAVQKDLIENAKNDTKAKAQEVTKTLNSWLLDVSRFKENVIDSSKAEFHELNDKWETDMTNKWNHGLDKVIEASRKAKSEKEEMELLTSLNSKNTE